MKHLEMVREVEEHRRGMKMSRGLASFVEGHLELVEAEVEHEETEGNKIAGRFKTDSGITRTKSKSGSLHGSIQGSISSNRVSISIVERKEKEYSNALAKSEEAILASHTRSDSLSSRTGLESESQPNSFVGTSIAQSTPNQDTLEPSPGEDLSEASSIKVLFSRAANLIREAFEVDGGAVFYDAQRGFGNPQLQQKPVSSVNISHEDSHTSGDDLQSSSEQHDDYREKSPQQTSPRSTGSGSSGLGEGVFTRSSTESKKIVEILGFSTADASSIHGDDYPGPQSFTPFDEKSLHTLLRRYPRGKLWTFDSDGAVSSSSEEEPINPQHKDLAQQAKELYKRKMRSARAKSDARFLSRHFPGLRQLLFVPLWDAGRSRWLSGCCVWSTEPTRILSKQSELAFLTAFGNSVMAECSRIDTEIADQKKGDFIGSVSHELRSPLHGVLASAEFLGDEDLSGFQKTLVQTIDSCGRTLLDTIVRFFLPCSFIYFYAVTMIRNHPARFSHLNSHDQIAYQGRINDLHILSSQLVSFTPSVFVACVQLTDMFQNHILDFSKINHFEKNWRKNRRRNRPIPRSSSGAMALRQSDLPMINLFADVDISVVCEEVVEGVFAGQVYQNGTAQTFDMVPGARGRISDNEMMGVEKLQHSNVAVILDVDIQNYHFTTQPGAFRRVIMNLLGNALKYTSHGYVRIVLEATEMEDLHIPGSSDTIPRSMVAVTVMDTGKGISSEFLRSKLFMPFAQEVSTSASKPLLSRLTFLTFPWRPTHEGGRKIKNGNDESSFSAFTHLVELCLLRNYHRIRFPVVLALGFPLSEVLLPCSRATSPSTASWVAALVSWNQLLYFIIILITAAEVRVTLPLLREMPKTADSNTSSTPKSTTSIARDTDESVSLLRARVMGQKVSLHGFDLDTIDPIVRQTGKLLQASVTNFLTNWYGLKVVSFGQRASIIVLNEANPPTISKVLRQSTINGKAPAILVLCSHSSPRDRSAFEAKLSANIGFLPKPVAPLKLARALIECLQGAPSTITPGLSEAPSGESNDISIVFEELSMSPHGGEVLDNSRMAADSENARKAIESPTPNASIEKHQEFPFPVEERPPASKTQSMPIDKESLKPLTSGDVARASALLSQMEVASTSTSSTGTTEPTPALSTQPSLLQLQSPRLLLVDDNKINLTLLRTYMHKRKYEVIDEAENGLEAVHKLEEREDGYDIIFMDISMPILDGFGATRQIRAIEASRKRKALENTEKGEEPAVKDPALVIALTGLASSRDQNEAFTSGIDLFLTKPVAFKEVGKLLDNWEANRERA